MRAHAIRGSEPGKQERDYRHVRATACAAAVEMPRGGLSKRL
ncbi:hypothetical protein K788_0003743 [Paraburkholderia caribensis MBA4]|uniref:Uncharacterized protein n=1 Tax=Paraburkholderia caribensis MBA4 TaxID=1323664 RepID=A0A0P0RBE2_9BURK|nr:hypothetical protein K788_0003743 [Paraburkholderia caribensis MBA4]